MEDFFGGVIAGRKLDFVFEEDDGAHARIRTGDLRLTKAMLYHLSYVGARTSAEEF